MMLLLKNQEKHPESRKVSIPTFPERRTNLNVNWFIILVPPKNAKEVDEKKKGDKAN